MYLIQLAWNLVLQVETYFCSPSYPMTLLPQDNEELSQTVLQLPDFFGVSAAPLSEAFHQRDVGPQFVHHTSILV